MEVLTTKGKGEVQIQNRQKLNGRSTSGTPPPGTGATKRTVAEILAEDYEIEAVAGQKCECPKCGAPHFGIKGDDSVGKCFGPSCGFFITSETPRDRAVESFQGAARQIYADFKWALYEAAPLSVVATEYLTITRRIAPEIISAAPIGVVPQAYDCREIFQPILDDLKAMVDGAPRDEKKDLQAELDAAQNKVDNLQETVRKAAGWIVFFHMDSKQNIGRLRFRKPHSRKFMSWQTPKTMPGVFGLDMGTALLEEDNNDSGLLVVEGEFNVLTLQSTQLNYCKTVGIEPRYLFACAVGSASGADYTTIRFACRRPTIIYDNDSGGSGYTLVKNAREHMTVFATTTPIAKDLDEHIKAIAGGSTAAMASVVNVVRSRAILARSAESIADVIRGIRANKGKAHQINDRVATMVREDLQDFSYFYQANEKSYLFRRDTKELIAIVPTATVCVLLMDRYALNGTEGTYAFVVESLRVKVLQQGAETAIHRLSYFNEETFTVYITNFRNQVIKIGPDKIETVDNGTDNVIFLMDKSCEPIEYDPAALNPGRSTIDEHILSKMNVASGAVGKGAIKVLCLLWLISMFFPQKLLTRAIIAFIGPKGSGKSITLRKFGRLIFGRKFNVTPLSQDVKDFDAALTNSAYLAIDNADSKIDYLPDRLAMAATGGSHKRREYYTTNDLIEFHIDCFLGISSRTPEFTRDDVTDRLLPIPVERFAKYIPEGRLLAEVDKNRRAMLAELIQHVQEATKALKKHACSDDTGVFRIADFGDFALKVCREAGCEEEIKNAFAAIVLAQSKMALEGSALTGLLFTFAKENPGKALTATELCEALTQLAVKTKTRFEYANNERGLAQKLPHLKSNLEQLFIVKEVSCGGHVKKWAFTVKPESDNKAGA